MRVAVVQYGVFHDRYAALKAGEPETYYAQAYSVNFIAELAEQCEFLGVIGVLGEEPGETAVSDRLRSACVPAINGAPDAPAIIALLEKWRPDRLIL